jgi:hypothetical protein
MLANRLASSGYHWPMLYTQVYTYRTQTRPDPLLRAASTAGGCY